MNKTTRASLATLNATVSLSLCSHSTKKYRKQYVTYNLPLNQVFTELKTPFPEATLHDGWNTMFKIVMNEILILLLTIKAKDLDKNKNAV